MRRMSAVSRPAWATAISGNGVNRKSPVEVFATAASVVTRNAELSGLSAGKFGRWTDGVTTMRADCIAFAEYWHAHNERVLRERAQEAEPGPLWVALGDSTAQGLGAPGPYGGYVGQALREMRRRTGQHWQVLNLSVSGALVRDVLAGQLPQLPPHADLVTCGVGPNDILYSAPAKLFGDMRSLLATVPDQTIVLDLPLLTGFWWIVGRMSVPYITRLNRLIHDVAAARGLPVAEVSAANSRATASTRARMATATGPAPCSPRSRARAWLGSRTTHPAATHPSFAYPERGRGLSPQLAHSQRLVNIHL